MFSLIASLHILIGTVGHVLKFVLPCMHVKVTTTK